MNETPREQLENAELEFIAQYTEEYKIFQENFNPKRDVIYYPACGTDVGPWMIFSDSRIVYADVDEKIIEHLRNNGFEAYCERESEFTPDKKVDILILINPDFQPEKSLEHVAAGGYVLCNDFNGTATAIRDNPDLELIGIIRRKGETGECVLDTSNVEDYWREVETEEEFKKSDPDFGARAVYEVAARLVKDALGKTGNVLEGYKKLYELAAEQARERNAKLIAEYPDMAELDFGDEGAVRPYKLPDGRVAFLLPLPRKKGTGLFVYRKLRKIAT